VGLGKIRDLALRIVWVAAYAVLIRVFAILRLFETTKHASASHQMKKSAN
jgi:hypothetical protein